MFNQECNFMLEKIAAKWNKMNMLGIASKSGEGGVRAHIVGNERSARLLGGHHNAAAEMYEAGIGPREHLQQFRNNSRDGIGTSYGRSTDPITGAYGRRAPGSIQRGWDQALSNSRLGNTGIHQTVKKDKFPPFSF